VSPRASVPLTNDISAAIAMFFHGGAGPSHTVVSRVLTGTGYGDDYTYDPDVQGTTRLPPRCNRDCPTNGVTGPTR